MTPTIVRVSILVGGLTASLLLTGCATVEPWQRGRLAHRSMTFDADSSQIAYLTHWQEAREGASGGFGVLSGGCGCK